jgi:poly(A) polymerase
VKLVFRLFARRKREAPTEVGPELSVSEALVMPRPSDIFMRWALDGRLRDIMPDLDALRGVSQAPAHRDDAFIHTLKVVDAIEAEPRLRWAALLHDIGKGPTYIEAPDGRSRFFEHDKFGTVMVPEIMGPAGEPPELIEAVARLVSLHMRPISYNAEWTDAAVRRLQADAEDGRGPDGWRDLLALARADLRGYLPEPIDRGLWVLDSLEAHARQLAEEEAAAEVVVPHSPLDGDALMVLAAREPGAWVGALKEHLTDMVVAGSLAQEDVKGASEAALRWLEEQERVDSNRQQT